MSGPSTYEPKTGFERWLDSRLPLVRFMHDTAITFPTPKNLNYWYTFGGILAVMLGIQIATGIVLAMHYVPHVDYAFASVERIMRDVNYGWLIRYMHANGASMFFLAVYLHILRALYYGSYKAPREVLWILGCLIYFLMMATAFMGYVLPWGQMSFHGAVVITNLIGSLPIIRFANDTMISFPTPKNLNYWYTFGGILALMLGIQIVTGIVLAMHYIPQVDLAFNSIQRSNPDFGS